MRSYTITLSSNQQSSLPQVLDHYFIYDPLSGSNFVYPNTASGDFFNYTTSPAVTADDDLITPWGYVVQNLTTDINIGPLKGPYQIIFDPSGLDTTKSAILKIVYNFGDGTETTISRKIVPPFVTGQPVSASNPNAIPVIHEYYPSNNSDYTIFNPKVTVYNGNLVQNTYNISITASSQSLYDFYGIHLINNTQQLTASETQNIFEVEQPNFVTIARVLSTSDVNYPTVYPFDPNTSLANFKYNLITWLDASDAVTIAKNSDNNIIVWYDKSAYKNNYNCNIIGVDSPVYLYPRQSQSLRKCIHFTSGQYLYSASGPGSLGDTVFYQPLNYSQGLSIFAVAKFNQIGNRDTLFSYDLNLNEDYTDLNSLNAGFGLNYIPYANISVNGQNNSITVEQGDTSFYYKTSAQDIGNNYFPTNTGPISQNLNNYNLFSVTISGNLNATTFITADTAVIKRKNQNYQNSYLNLGNYLSGGYNPSTLLYPPTGTIIVPTTYDYWLVKGLLGASNAYPDSTLTDAEISEIMIFNTPLSQDAIAQVQNYLITKWGLTLQTD